MSQHTTASVHDNITKKHTTACVSLWSC